MQKTVLGRLLAVPTHHLSDESWIGIARISGLPTEARSDVERAVSIYKISNIGSKIDETRRDLANTEKRLRSVQSDLAKLAANPRAIAALSFSGTGDNQCEAPGKARASLAAADKYIAGMIEQISSGRGFAVRARKPGAHEDAVRAGLFIKLLDDILFSFTGRHISRSSKRDSPAEYVAAVCEAANLDVSRSSIDEAIKTITRTQGKIARGEIASHPIG